MNSRALRPLAAAPTLLALACALLPLLAPLPALAQAADGATPQQAAPQPRRNSGRVTAPVTLNFVNAEIEAVSRAMAVMIDRQILVDPRVKGVITVYSEQPLPVSEAWRQFLAALRGLGFAVVDNAGLLKVVPEADAKLQAGTVSVGTVASRGDQVITQVFRLNYENPNNLVAVLRPLISPNNTINANPGNNTLVITDYADNLSRLGKIIAALDQPSSTDIEVVPLRHAIAADLATLVQKLGDAGATTVPGAPVTGGGGVSVTADARSNALIVRAANPARLAAIRALIDRLDTPGLGGPAGQIHVVYLKNADAAKLATVLRAAFGGGSAGSGGGGSSAPTATTPTSGIGALGSAAGSTGGNAGTVANTPLASSAQPSTGGFIQADPATNSLVITAAEPLYRQIRAVIDQLDGRRAQVYIESMVVEVSGDDAADFGFQWQGLLGQRGDKWGLFAGTNSSIGGSNIVNLSTSLAGLAGSTTSVSEGLNIGLLRNYGGSYTLGALARLLQSNSKVNIVSTPNLITLDNEEAKIIVGSNVPFVTGQYTSTGTGTTNPFQTIERKDVGLTLRIRPQVGEGGTVRMQIFQESSSVSEKVAPGTSNAGPSTDKRSIESTVIVDDGGTLVLGGLIEDRFTVKQSKVPGLGDLPWVGGLFRSESRSKTRTNLMVFLRPVVLRDAQAANSLSVDRYEQIRAQQQVQQPGESRVLDIGGAAVAPELPAKSVPAKPATEVSR